MKASRKVLSLALSLILMLCLAAVMSFGITAEGAPSLDITHCNISFRDSVVIKYAVYAENIDAPIQNVKLLVWNAPQTEYTLGTQNSTLTSVGTQNISGKEHVVFDYAELTAKQMTDEVYTRAYAEIDGEAYYSDVNKYSILQYVYNKLGKTGVASTSEKLTNMLNDMLRYGASSQLYFDYKTDTLATDEFYQVKVDGGVLEDGTTVGLFVSDTSVTLAAPEISADGYAFSCWKNSEDISVSLTATATITVGTTNETYTAVYESVKYSSGLEFTSNGDGTCYVSNIGNCTDVDIIIPRRSPAGDTVTSLGYRAFYNQTQIISAVIPDSVTSISSSAFDRCTSLKSVAIPNTVTSIGDYAFYCCKALKDVVLPVSIKSIETYTFSDCSSLESIEIPDGVTVIKRNAFSRCSSLTTIIIPSSVTNVGIYAFEGCTSLIFSEYGNALYIGSLANPYLVLIKAKDTSISDCSIHKDARFITSNAFQNCAQLENVIFPENSQLIDIGAFAFSGCSSLTDINIPDTVTSIGHFTFSSCSSLKTINIPTNATFIDTGAFKGCKALTSVTIPENMISIGYLSFSSCSSLTNVYFAENSKLSVIDTQAFESCGKLTDFVIPDSVKTVGKWAFYKCSSLASLTVPTSVTSIGEDILYRCTKVTSIYYLGDEIGWNSISIHATNSQLASSTVYYYSNAKPVVSGNYWHYVDGVPTIWGTSDNQ